MAIKRLEFFNTPSAVIDHNQRSQVGIGYYFAPIPPMSDDITYFKRYLDDPSTVVAPGPPVVPSVLPESPEITYFRRYLQDLV